MASEWSQREGGGALITPATGLPMVADVGGLPNPRAEASHRRRGRRGRQVFAGTIMAVLQVADFGGRKPGQCARESGKYRAVEPLFRQTSEYICKLKSFTKESPCLIETPRVLELE